MCVCVCVCVYVNAFTVVEMNDVSLFDSFFFLSFFLSFFPSFFFPLLLLLMFLTVNVNIRDFIIRAHFPCILNLWPLPLPQNTVDLLVGWHIDVQQDQSLIDLISSTLISMGEFWTKDMPFSVELLKQFLEDMDAYSSVSYEVGVVYQF